MQAVKAVLGRNILDDCDASRVGTYYDVIYRIVSAHVFQDILRILALVAALSILFKLGLAILQRITK